MDAAEERQPTTEWAGVDDEEPNPEAAPLMSQGEPCPGCGLGGLVVRRGRFGNFLGCSRYPDCTYVWREGPPPPEQLPFTVPCPTGDGDHLVARRKRRTGEVFWGCFGYPRCDFTTSLEPTGAFHDAHADGLGAVALNDGTGECLTCGAVVPLPSGALVGLRLPGDRPVELGRKRPPRRPVQSRSRREPSTEPKAAWRCPEHGDADVVILTSRAGRVYGACRLCEAFDDGLTDEQRAERIREAERERAKRAATERAEAERKEAEHQAQIQADRVAPTCAHCGKIERLHTGEPHPFAGGRLAHAEARFLQLLVIVGVCAALWLFWLSATTPDAPLHSVTAPLLCFWDVKGTVCQ